MKKLLLFLMLLATSCHPIPTRCPYATHQKPQIIIAVVIDQFAYAYIEKLKPYLKFGLKTLLEKGIVYTNIHTAYAWPATGPGHTTLNTGATPCNHGIVNNNWPISKDTQISCDEDTVERAAVFGPNGLLNYGRSARNIMVDGISDQLMLQTKQHASYKVFSVSAKSGAAICTANKLGKAIWFEDKHCMFTSSKAYFENLPAWLRHFNEKKKLKNATYRWNLSQPNLPAAYRFAHAHDYTNSGSGASMIGKTYNVCDQRHDFMHTPYINQLVFEAAAACFDAHFCKNNRDEKLFLWVLPSALDLAGHDFGPDSVEAIDMIYHLDRQLGEFMNCIKRKTRADNVLWALTADHGITAIPEQLVKEGYTQARRISPQDLTGRLNNHLKKLFNVEQIVTLIKGSSLFVDEALFKSLEKTMKKAVTQEIKTFMSAQPGIKEVRTFSELTRLCTHEYSILDTYKNQLFKGRSARFLLLPFPYNYISTKKGGTGHQSPYNPDTHIPLVLYQPGRYQRKIMYEKAYNTQLAPTLAYILGVPCPSACTADILPGVISDYTNY